MGYKYPRILLPDADLTLDEAIERCRQECVKARKKRLRRNPSSENESREEKMPEYNYIDRNPENER